VEKLPYVRTLSRTDGKDGPLREWVDAKGVARRATSSLAAVPAAPATRPDVLVLAGGGTLGEAWMTGLLAGLEDAGGLDLREVEAFVGTSAGSIVAARLAAGKPLRRPRSLPPESQPASGPATEPADAPTAKPADAPIAEPASAPRLGVGRSVELVAGALAAPAAGAVDWIERTAGPLLAPLIGPAIGPVIGPVIGRALRLERRPGALVRGRVLSLVPAGTRSLAELERSIERDQGRFDGRLRIVGVDRRTGHRVVFGAPGAPEASVAKAVAASCSIPGFFAPIEIAGREYVDGGVWSLTNLDAAPVGRRTQLLCLNPMRGLPVAAVSRLGLVGSVVRGREALEVAVVRGRGARVRRIGPDADSGRLMAPSLMDPDPREAVLHAGYAQGLALGRPG
jgi:NTE family protein